MVQKLLQNEMIGLEGLILKRFSFPTDFKTLQSCNVYDALMCNKSVTFPLWYDCRFFERFIFLFLRIGLQGLIFVCLRAMDIFYLLLFLLAFLASWHTIGLLVLQLERKS